MPDVLTETLGVTLSPAFCLFFGVWRPSARPSVSRLNRKDQSLRGGGSQLIGLS